MAIILPQQMGPPPTSVVRQKIPEGDAGARFTLYAMKDLVWSYDCKDVHLAVIRRVTDGCKTDRCRIDAVYNWCNSILQYQLDPEDTELVKSPCRIFREVREGGKAYGDCDDISVLLCASFQLLGMPVGFQAVSNGKATTASPLDHVMCIVFDRDRKEWISVDPVAPGKQWDGHKQMIELVPDAPPLYWLWSKIKSFFSNIVSGINPELSLHPQEKMR